MENTIKMDDLGVPLFSETSIQVQTFPIGGSEDSLGHVFLFFPAGAGGKKQKTRHFGKPRSISWQVNLT